MRHPTLSPLADTAAADDTAAPPEWPPRRCDLPWTPPEGMRAAALVGEAYDPWPIRHPREQRAECARQRTKGRLEGAVIGACIVIATLIGGCAVIVALERAEPMAVPAAASTQ